MSDARFHPSQEPAGIRDSVYIARSQIFAWLIAFRLFNAIFVKTIFQPDEYYQALEPAWKIVFGDESGAWITWEWKHHLRSTLHPYLFAAVYYIADRLAFFLKLSSTSRADLLLVAPKVLQTVLAAISDLYTWKLGELIYGLGTYGSWLSLFLSLLNPFHFFVITRTLSNCLELTLNTIAFYLWYTCISSGSICYTNRLANEHNKPDSPTDKTVRSNARRSGDSDVLASNVDSFTSQEDSIKSTALNKSPDQMPIRLRVCLILAALACVLRITNLITWMTLASFKFVDYHANWISLIRTRWLSVSLPLFRPRIRPWTRTHWILIRETISCGLVVIGATAVLDRTFYHEWTFPPLQFLQLNIQEGISEFYGINDVSWYFSQGFPLLLGAFLPFAIQAMIKYLLGEVRNKQHARLVIKTELAAVALFVPVVFSFVAHKEVRFIYPILPILHLLAAGPVASFFMPILRHRPFARREPAAVKKYVILYGVVFLNFASIIAISRYHQCAPLSVMSFLRHEHETKFLSQPPAITGLALADTSMTVGFLMPCHSTPWRSHLIHLGIKGWALGCEPPIGLNKAERRLYRDEADLFYDNPASFLQDVLGQAEATGVYDQRQEIRKDSGNHRPMAWDGKIGQKMWPNYLVFFAEKEEALSNFLKGAHYTQCWRGWNSWVHDDWRRRGDIIVWCDRVAS